MNARIQDSKQAKRQGPNLLDEVLERRVLLYVLAAGATLASASAAQAQVVFTPSHAVLYGGNSSLDIDLNNDGVTDFTLVETLSFSWSGTFNHLNARGSQDNRIVVNPANGLARALKRGNTIGSGELFATGGLMAYICRRSGFSTNPCYSTGSFNNTTKHFLGVKFLINGQVHYGWIGFRSVDSSVNATLGGWAYETQPNTPIIAGDTGREDFNSAESDSSSLRKAEPTSLELLAAGHVAIAERRRRIAG